MRRVLALLFILVLLPYASAEDTDNDGVEDDVDSFPWDASQQTDGDDDGFGDNFTGYQGDACLSEAGTSMADRFGCLDSDGDYWSDANDAFPNDPNQWRDSDGDGKGDNLVGEDADYCPSSSGALEGCEEKKAIKPRQGDFGTLTFNMTAALSFALGLFLAIKQIGFLPLSYHEKKAKAEESEIIELSVILLLIISAFNVTSIGFESLDDDQTQFSHGGEETHVWLAANPKTLTGLDLNSDGDLDSFRVEFDIDTLEAYGMVPTTAVLNVSTTQETYQFTKQYEITGTETVVLNFTHQAQATGIHEFELWVHPTSNNIDSHGESTTFAGAAVNIAEIPCSSDEVRITEVSDNGTPNDWVEVHNSGGQCSLSGWEMYNNETRSTEAGDEFTFDKGTQIDSGEYMLICKITHTKTGDCQNSEAFEFEFELEDDEIVYLWNPIDEVEHSLEILVGETSTEWCDSSPKVAQEGEQTPGSQNSCIPPESPTTNWINPVLTIEMNDEHECEIIANMTHWASSSTITASDQNEQLIHSTSQYLNLDCSEFSPGVHSIFFESTGPNGEVGKAFYNLVIDDPELEVAAQEAQSPVEQQSSLGTAVATTAGFAVTLCLITWLVVGFAHSRMNRRNRSIRLDRSKQIENYLSKSRDKDV